MPPLVSIILPTFNRREYLEDTICSIFAQTFQDWQLLIADDGSDAETLSYLSGLARDKRVRLLRLTHSGNPPAVRNAALREAAGSYIAFIDSDDIWQPEKLARQIGLLEAQPSRGWSYTGATLVDERLDALTGMRAMRPATVAGWLLVPLLEMKAIIVQSSVVVRRELLDKARGYDESFPVCGDYELWLRLSQLSPAALIAAPLVLVRRHADHYSDDIAACQDFRRVLDKMQHAATTPQLSTLVRRRRASASAVLAQSCAVRGSRSEVFGALFSSARYSWRYVEWWRGATSAVARACAPASVRRVVRWYRAEWRRQ